MRVFERHRVNARLFDCIGNSKIRIKVGLGVILAIEFVGVTATHMHGALNLFGATMKSMLQVIESKFKCLIGFACKQGLINLNMLTPRFCQCQDFDVKCLSNIVPEFFGIVVKRIAVGIRNRHRAGHGNFNRTVATFLRSFPVFYEELIAN